LRLAGLATGRVGLTNWVVIVFQTALITLLVAPCGVAIAGVVDFLGGDCGCVGAFGAKGGKITL